MSNEPLIELYHGSNVIVKKPNLYAGKPRHDLGRGFYLTTDIDQAKKWSRHKLKRNKSIYRDSSFEFLVSKYVLNRNDLTSLKIKKFDEPDESWLNYVVRNRIDIEFAVAEDYDLVVGSVVDGNSSWLALDLYSKHKLSFRNTIKRIKPDNLEDQWVFKTNHALKFLTYGGVIYEEK